MSSPFVAEIRVMPYNFAPSGWAFCNGQLLPIAQNTALFSLVGTYYGGDGRSTFGLPNLQGCFAMGAGQGAGLSERFLGEAVGSADVTLQGAQLPNHGHALMAGSSGTAASPAGAVMAPPVNGSAAYRAPATASAMAAETIAPTGGNQPHENRQPYLGLNFCIAMQGIFPPRSRSSGTGGIKGR